ncbi:hypothetical protein ES703_66050 [subsurface metagenome]
MLILKMLKRQFFIVPLVIILASSKLYGIDGNWRLESYFMQTILEGEISALFSAQRSPIIEIQIDKKTRKKYKTPPFPSKIKLIYGQQINFYDAKTIELIFNKSGSILFLIEDLDDLCIQINVLYIDDDTYWYSYSIVPDFEKEKLYSSKGKNTYSNFIGIMKRID